MEEAFFCRDCKVKINDSDFKRVNINNKNFVEFRDLMEAFGHDVEWVDGKIVIR